MAYAFAGIVFAPALAVGSFLNVVAARVPLRRSIVKPASACMSCATELAWYDNVPLVSWALVGPLRAYRPIRADRVARAMVRVAKEAPRGVHLYESGEL